MKKVLIAHPFGNQNVRHAAIAFAEAGMLSELWVGASWDDEHWVNHVLPSRLRSQLQRRTFPRILKPYIKQTFVYEATRMLLPILGLRRLAKQYFSVVAAHEHLDRKVSARLKKLPNVGLIYGYDHCALETFRVASQRDIRRVLELPIPSWRGHIKILQEEMELHPTWHIESSTLSNLAESGTHKDAELAMAETVIVPCDFVKKCLLDDGFPADRIRVIPYGAPQVSRKAILTNVDQPLRILFVGSIGLRKGVPYLLDAIKILNCEIKLTFIGGVESKLQGIVREINNHKWFPSLTHQEVLGQMRQHDVLVFPSLYEGFGLVILEALSQGLPVISTAHTGATHVIEDGINGFIVPVRSASAIAEKIELLDSDRDLLHQMQIGAKVKAVEYSWGQYRSKLVQEISTIIG